MNKWLRRRLVFFLTEDKLTWYEGRKSFTLSYSEFALSRLRADETFRVSNSVLASVSRFFAKRKQVTDTSVRERHLIISDHKQSCFAAPVWRHNANSTRGLEGWNVNETNQDYLQKTKSFLNGCIKWLI